MKNFYFLKARWLLTASLFVFFGFGAHAQYCEDPIEYSDGVEAITSVVFGGISVQTAPDNTTDYLDYTASSANVNRGLIYSLYVQGNTGGSWSDYITIFIDWNQNGAFGPGEAYSIGTPLYNSTGNDGQTVSTAISIPLTAALGVTTMRVVKKFNGSGTACETSGYGQTQDFSLNVLAAPACLPPSDVAFVAATSGTATLAWTASTSTGATAYEFYVSQSETPPADTATGIAATGTTGTTISSLSASTLYYTWVRTQCSATTYSPWSQSVSFTTQCLASSSPFGEDFGGAALPSCWGTTSSNASAATGIWKFAGNPDWDNGNTREDGTYAWVDGSSPSNIDNVTLLSPIINLAGLTAPQLVFDYFSNNGGIYPNNIFKVDIFNGTSWVNLYTNNTNLADWRIIEIPLLAYVGTSVQFRFVVDKTAAPADNAYYNDILLDNVKIEQMPTCIKPTNLTAVAPSYNTINLSWTASISSPSAGYEYYISDDDTEPSPTTPGVDVPTGLTASFTTAQSNTQYYVYVRSDCGGGDLSAWTQAAVVTTPCAAYIVNFLEEFEEGLQPACWTTTSSAPTGTGLWKFSGAVDYDLGNTRPDGTFAWVDGSSPSNIANVTLVSPPINMTGLTVPQLSFDYFSNNSGTYPNNIFSVDIFNGTTWTNIYTNNTSNADWRLISIPLPSYAGMTVQFRFVVDKTAAPADNSYLNDILLDNVAVNEAPLCIAPTNVNLTAVSKFSATVNWTASVIAPSNDYDIYYSTDPTMPGSGTAANGGTAVSTGVTLSALTSSTTYYVWVRGNCGANGGSAWTPVASFTTLCDFPTVTAANGGTACGQGNVALTGTPSSGQLYWWTAATGGEFLASGNTFNTPTITTTTNYYVSAASTIPDTNVAFGTGNSTDYYAGYSPYYHGYGGNKTQYIIRASELHAAGMAPGPINSLTYTITQLGTVDVFSDFAVSIGATTQNAATNTHIDNLSLVYYNAAETLIAGDNTYNFTTPFVWDGISNIVVQTCYSNFNYGGSSSYVAYNTTSFPAATFTYADNQTAEDICAATTGGVGGSGDTGFSSIRPHMKFNANSLCASPRQMVTATITNAVAIEADASENVICSGESTILTATSTNANYTYVWTPGNLTGPTQTVSPTADITYTVTATDATTSCVTTFEVDVTVNALPAPLAITASNGACSGKPTMLTVTGGQAIPTEYCTPVVTGSPGDTGDFIADVTFAGISNLGSDDPEGDYTYYDDMTATVTAGASYPITLMAGGTSSGYAMQFGVWIDLDHSGSFDGNEFLFTTVTPTYSPTTSTGNIIIPSTAYNGMTRMRVAGRYSGTFGPVFIAAADGCQLGSSASGAYGEFEDYNINITGGVNAAEYVWSPATNLYTDAAGTVAYTGQPASTVYAVITQNTTFTVNASSTTGCETVDTETVNVINVAPPTGSATQIITVDTPADATVSDIVVNETGVIWYASEADAITGVGALSANTQLVDGATYYGVLATSNCQSAPLAVTVDVALGKDNFDMSAFSYHPNPVIDVLNISYSEDITTVNIFNLLGQKVITREINAAEVKIDMSHLADGPYIVNVNSGDSVKTIKVIRKH